MSWRNSLWCVLIPLLLAGCGFQPLYGSRDPNVASKVLAGVKIDPIAGQSQGRMSQIFKSELEDGLNPGGAVS